MVKKHITVFVLALLLLCQCVTITYANDFNDVNRSHWAYEYVYELRSLGITDGIGNNNFGIGRQITRAEFAAFVCKLMKWEIEDSSDGSFLDNTDPTKWYFYYVETAVKNGAVNTGDGYFYPNEFITRADMAVMVVCALGYGELGKQLDYLDSPFSDVQNNTGYITIAKDLGIVSGISASLFAPSDTATREQAAVMAVKMYRLLKNEAVFTNGFYAISSYSQIDLIDSLDSVAFGWSRLELVDVPRSSVDDGTDGSLLLNTASDNSNEYSVPDGYQEPLSRAQGKERLLMVAVKESDSPKIINNAVLRDKAVDILTQAVISGITEDSIAFDGIVLDFEALKGQEARDNYNDFLTKLRSKLPTGKIYVAVQPRRRPGFACYDGYDYRTIGEIADKVILMAHDYYPRSLTETDMLRGITNTPAAPLDEVYYAVKAICDPDNGVADRNKVLLQISFDSVQWKSIDGKTINSTPYSPNYSLIEKRIKDGAFMGYDNISQSPFISFFNPDDQTHNYVWYEDTRSARAKIQLASFFGLGGMSYWRLGIIPDFSEEVFLNILETI